MAICRVITESPIEERQGDDDAGDDIGGVERLEEPGQVPARRRVALEELLTRQRVVRVVCRRPDQVQTKSRRSSSTSRRRTPLDVIE